MLDPISNTNATRDYGSNQQRAPASPATPAAPAPALGLAPDQRVTGAEQLQKKIVQKKSMSDSRLRVEVDEKSDTYIYQTVDQKTGDEIGQWPTESLVQLKQHLAKLEGILLDEQV